MITAGFLRPALGVPRALEKESRAVRIWGRRLVWLSLVGWAVGLVAGFEVALIALTIGSFTAVVLGLRRPTLGVLGLAMLCTLDAVARVFVLVGGVLPWNTINYWLLAVMALWLPFLSRLKDTQSRLLQVFLLLLTVQLMFSADRLLGAQHILGVAVYFGLLVYFTRSAAEPRVWYWVGVVSGTLAAGAGCIYYLQIGRLPYINPNVWAYVPLTGLFAGCLGVLSGRLGARRQGTVLLLATVNGVWVFLTGSRGGLLIALTCLAFLVATIRPLPRRAAMVVAGLLLAVGIASQFSDLQALGIHRVGVLFDQDRSLVSRTSGRSDLVVAGWHIFLRHPLGVGTGGFPDAWTDLGDLGGLLMFHRTGVETQAHSGWIKTLAENGVPGAVLLGAFVLSFAFVGWRRGKRDPQLRLLGVLVSGVLAVAFISTEFQGKGLWFLAAGAAAVFRRAASGRRARPA